MNVSFCLFKYFPFGGLQRDFFKIASKCLERGHTVDVFTMSWEGAALDGANIHELPVCACTNHGKARKFAALVQERLAHLSSDVVVGFNKMPGLDIYFAADPCYQARVLESKSSFYRMTTRYKIYQAMEQAVFGRSEQTEILLLSHQERDKFVSCYETPEERFHLMPPGITQREACPEDDRRVRRKFRSELGLNDDDNMLLMVGSAFHTKGVDRAIRGLAELPDECANKSLLIIVGHGNHKPMSRLASKLGIIDRVRFLGVQDDVFSYYLAADLLVHPARTEAAGMVLIEALTCGLPVLVTDVCGYAFHVKKAAAGTILPSPFDQNYFTEELQLMLDSEKMSTWRKNGLDYAARTNLYSLPEQATDFIEQVGLA